MGRYAGCADLGQGLSTAIVPPRVRQYDSRQHVPGRATTALFGQVAFIDQLPKMLLEGVAADARQLDHLADADAPVFARVIEDTHGMFWQA